MRRLLWKELRERRLWFLALLAAVVTPMVFGQSFTFCGGMLGALAISPVIVALLLGAGAHSSEISSGAIQFVRSRPVSWKKALLAKVIVALGIIIAATLVSAVAFCVLRPPAYSDFVTIDRLWAGFWLAVMLQSIAFAVGLVCSVVIPGAIGGVLTGTVIVLAICLQMMIYGTLSFAPNFPWSIYAWMSGTLTACILTMRFGLTLPSAQRLKRYGVVVLIFAAAGIALDIVLPTVRFDTRFGGYYLISISPDGRYSIGKINGFGILERAESTYVMTELENHKKYYVSLPSGLSENHWRWTRDHSAFVWAGSKVWSVSLRKNRAVVQSATVKPENGNYEGEVMPSPDGSRAIFVRRYYGDLVPTDVFDLRRMQTVSETFYPQDYWWQSNTEVGYTDRKGKRHIVRVIPAKDNARGAKQMTSKRRMLSF